MILKVSTAEYTEICEAVDFQIHTKSHQGLSPCLSFKVPGEDKWCDMPLKEGTIVTVFERGQEIYRHVMR